MVASTATAPNLDGILLLESPFARVPHDELRRQLRTQQRLVEREFALANAAFDSADRSLAGGGGGGGGGGGEEVNEGQGQQSVGDVSGIDLVGDVSIASIDASTLPLSSSSSSEIERSLDSVIGRLKGLKRKLSSTVHESTASTLKQLDSRTAHLDKLHSIQSTASSDFDDWCRTRLDRMLIDWMLRKGYSRSAATLAKSRSIESFTDLTLFSEIVRVEASLGGNSMEEEETKSQVKAQRTCALALAWCSENKAALRKIKSTLEFDLRLQEFVELSRTRTPESLREAIAHSRKHLLPVLLVAPSSDKEKESGASTSTKTKEQEKEEAEEDEQLRRCQKQVSRAMGLLACGPKGWAYGDLYDEGRWETLRSTFRSCALQIHSMPAQPMLHIALSAGLSSLKLPACFADGLGGNNAANRQGDARQTGASLPAHLGGRTFGDERSNLLDVSGATTSVPPPPTFPPAAGLAASSPPTAGRGATSSLYAQAGSGSIPSSILNATNPWTVHQLSHDSSLSTSSSHNGSSNHYNNNNNSNSNGNKRDGHQAMDMQESKNTDCPVCDSTGLGQLAKEVPWSHHINSTLVCQITGTIMNENDPPMVLPNGRVYSRTALESLASATSDAMVQCPRTGDKFPFDSVQKIYIS